MARTRTKARVVYPNEYPYDDVIALLNICGLKFVRYDLATLSSVVALQTDEHYVRRWYVCVTPADSYEDWRNAIKYLVHHD